jgi:hypothetical protein
VDNQQTGWTGRRGIVVALRRIGPRQRKCCPGFFNPSRFVLRLAGNLLKSALAGGIRTVYSAALVAMAAVMAGLESLSLMLPPLLLFNGGFYG